MKLFVAILATVVWTGIALAEEHGHAAPAAEHSSTETHAAPAHPETGHAQPGHDQGNHEQAGHEAVPGPVLSPDSHWTTSMLIIVGALFLGAMVIGPIYRATRPAEIPPTHSHDEPPGSSHHHGRNGTVNHNAPEAHHH